MSEATPSLFDNIDFGEDPRIEKFKEFHRANPHVYKLFCRFALEATIRRDRFSARTVVHRLRWYTNIETKDVDGIKVNDHWSPFYARMFEADYPVHKGFFEHRKAVADTGGSHEGLP